MTGRIERLAERPLAPFVTVGPGQTAPTTSRQWIVVVDPDRGPLAAVPPEMASAAGPAPPEDLVRMAPEMIVADADAPVAAALRSPAFELLEPDCPVVLTRGATVVGVWAGKDLANAVMLGPSRFAGDTQLAGEIRDIAEIRRPCRYTEMGIICGHRLSFVHRPAVMPPCPNPLSLADHLFGW